MSKSSNDKTGSEVSLSGLDPIAALQAMPLADPASLPRAPAGVRVLSAEVKRTLSNVAASNRAEAIKGLRAVAQRLEQSPGELGDLAPTAAEAARAADRLERSEEVLARIYALAAVYESVSEVAQHDGRRLLVDTQDEVTRRVAKGKVQEADYAAVAAYFKAESEAIAEGRKSAAKQREEQAPAEEPKPTG